MQDGSQESDRLPEVRKMNYKVSLSDLTFTYYQHNAYNSVGRFLLPFKCTK